MVVFSGVVLDKESRDFLKGIVSMGFPSIKENNWVLHCHHMTICLGELTDKTLVGREVELTINSLGKDDIALAIGVSGFDFKIKNKVPHITLAINQHAGGKPQNSNDIKEWLDYFPDTKLKGIIKEVSYDKKK